MVRPLKYVIFPLEQAEHASAVIRTLNPTDFSNGLRFFVSLIKYLSVNSVRPIKTPKKPGLRN